MIRMLTHLGAPLVKVAQQCEELGTLLVRTCRGVLSREYPKGEILRQMYSIGNKSVFFICITMGFLGMVMVLQSGQQINRVTGDLSQVGPEFLRILIQEFAPTITAMMLATRVGAGIAAEIGSMKVTEQIDALRLCGISPHSYLVAPRFVASVAMMLVLTVFAVVVSYGLGGLTAARVFDLNSHLFFDASRVRLYDVVLGSCKALSYGAAIPLISAHCGLRARGGSQGVGGATTSAVIGSSIAILLLDLILSAIGFKVFGGGV